MNKFKLTIDQVAHQLRRDEIARLIESLYERFSDAMRINHEVWLRHKAHTTPRMKSVNGTPV